MRLPSPKTLKPSQAILFAPVALLCLLAATLARNACSRPVVRAEDSPDGSREALVFLEYSPLYPFTGEVRAFLEVRALPAHQPLTTRALGRHRWSSQAMKDYHQIVWSDAGRLSLRSADGARTLSLLLDVNAAEERWSATPASRRSP